MPIIINDCAQCGSLPVITMMRVGGDTRPAITCADIHPGAMIVGEILIDAIRDWNELNPQEGK